MSKGIKTKNYLRITFEKYGLKTIFVLNKKIN